MVVSVPSTLIELPLDTIDMLVCNDSGKPPSESDCVIVKSFCCGEDGVSLFAIVSHSGIINIPLVSSTTSSAAVLYFSSVMLNLVSAYLITSRMAISS